MLTKSFRVVCLSAVLAAIGLSGCIQPKDAIAISNLSIDFGLNERPITIDVWNKNSEIDALTIEVTPLEDWIVTDVPSVESAAPDPSTGALDKRSVEISIDRRRLAKGVHTGEIEFTGRGAAPVILSIRVEQAQDGQQDSLNFSDSGVQVEYSEPYLLDFRFALKDELNRSVVAEPGQFTVEAQEGSTPVDEEGGVHLKRAAARQLKIELVLDYTLSMQQSTGAIAAMENAAVNILLPALNEDALVGVTEFHRDDQPAARVTPFTVSRPFLADRIASIQDEFVNGFYSASRMNDAVYDATRRFGSGDPLGESRILLLFSDGRDTSSTRAANTVINSANNNDVRIYAIGFGANPNVAALQNLTTQTGGAYFPAANASQLQQAFQRIIEDLEGQYNVRWASLRRDDAPVTPSFTLRLGADSVFYRGPAFVAEDHDGPEGAVLQGLIKVVPSNSETNTTVFLRAEYVPRFIRRIRLFLGSAAPFTVRQVGFADDGLLAGWNISVTEDTVRGGKWVDLQSSTALDFATFGPMLRVDYTDLVPEDQPLFTELTADNTIYPSGQSFRVLGFE
jgi:hypothetical protein